MARRKFQLVYFGNPTVHLFGGDHLSMGVTSESISCVQRNCNCRFNAYLTNDTLETLSGCGEKLVIC